MIFKDKINEKGGQIRPEVEKLLKLAVAKQLHPGDLLLILVNGSFSAETIEFNKLGGEQLSPYMMGMGKEGWAEHTHFDFIDLYRTRSIHSELLPEYLKKHAWDPKRKKEIDDLTAEEGITIQVEMMIYLKIWEADMTIKKLYEFVRIINGESYDWHFKISQSNRDPGSTGTRQDIIRNMIRDKIRPFSEPLYNIIKDSYVTQLRNSIAHSKYSFLGRNIHPNNEIRNDPSSQLKAVTFDNWIDIFHSTLMLQNELIGLMNLIHKHYSNLAIKNKNLNEILVTKADGTTETRNTYYRVEYKEWVWESQMK